VDFNDYQRTAVRTDQFVDNPETGFMVALLGVAGETGTLLATHKKLLRDGEAYEDYRFEIAEDLGDLLWYLSDTATRIGVPLDEIAQSNLRKVQSRWPQHNRSLTWSHQPRAAAAAGTTAPMPSAGQLPPATRYDADYPDGERLPRAFEVSFAALRSDPTRVIGVLHDGRVLGDQLGDNAPFDDGYRWHDALHLGHLAVLGWSPVLRGLLGHKRKSKPQIDDIDDGGRAIAIEEGIAAFTFEYAGRHHFLDGVHSIDTDLLRTLKKLTRSLEVNSQTMREWQAAIIAGFDAWRFLRAHDGACVMVDLDRRVLECRELTSAERDDHALHAAEELTRRARRKEQLKALRQDSAVNANKDAAISVESREAGGPPH
jgi:hypothetical protein